MKQVRMLNVILLIMLTSYSVGAAVHIAPKLVKSPDDLTYAVGTTGNELIWAFDAHESNDGSSKYVVTIDDVVVPAHNFIMWQDNVDIVVNVDGFDLGSYIVKIIANDTGTDNNQATATSDTANVNVVIELPSTTEEPLPSSSSDANAFPITFLSLIIALTIGIPILKLKDLRK